MPDDYFPGWDNKGEDSLLLSKEDLKKLKPIFKQKEDLARQQLSLFHIVLKVAHQSEKNERYNPLIDNIVDKACEKLSKGLNPFFDENGDTLNELIYNGYKQTLSVDYEPKKEDLFKLRDHLFCFYIFYSNLSLDIFDGIPIDVLMTMNLSFLKALKRSEEIITFIDTNHHKEIDRIIQSIEGSANKKNKRKQAVLDEWQKIPTKKTGKIAEHKHK